jgi:D-beta-D-heptose 7-phosphate kinase/D-beta-D-heptose 1-phosphate adenosyltransferase
MNASRIQQLLDAAKSRRLLVIGDVMLDEFVWGKVSRISPEAPVPVLEVTGESQYPGGAANVARNLRLFCETVSICGLIGHDKAGEDLKALLREEGIETSGLVASGSMPTIVKTRFVARQQQVVRVDREKKAPPVPEVRKRAIEQIAILLENADGVIFEDYGKGLLDQALIEDICSMEAIRAKVVTADPNTQNPLRWSGVTVLKPNRGEAFAMAGRPDPGATEDPLTDRPLLETAQHLLETHNVPALLITLGEHGMLLMEKDRPPYHTPTRAREVYDVSGAGDTAIALFTLALCAGATLNEAAEVSNHASGVVVGKLGTATLTPEELIAAAIRSSTL